MVHFKFVRPFSDKVYKCMREGLRKLQSMNSQLHTLKLKLETDFHSNQTIDNNCATDLLFYKKSRNAYTMLKVHHLAGWLLKDHSSLRRKFVILLQMSLLSEQHFSNKS
jgi:hypothetical protein